MNTYSITISGSTALLLYKLKKTEIEMYLNLVDNRSILFKALSNLNKNPNKFPELCKNAFSVLESDYDGDNEREELIVEDDREWEEEDSFVIPVNKVTVELLNSCKLKILEMNREKYKDVPFDLQKNRFVDDLVVEISLKALERSWIRMKKLESVEDYEDEDFDYLIEARYFHGQELFYDIWEICSNN